MSRQVANALSPRWLLWLLAPLALALWSAPSAAAAVGFAPKVTYAAVMSPSQVAVDDFNADGDPDLMVRPQSRTTMSMRLGGPAGSFGAHTVFSVGRTVTDFAIDDFNADGDPDLAVTTTGELVRVLVGQAGGSFGPPTDFPAGPSLGGIEAGDFNGDGDPDLVVTNAPFQGPSTLSVLLGGPGASFGPPTPEGSPGSIGAVSDFNGDGDLDLAGSNSSSNTISVRLGEIGGSFGAPTAFPVHARPTWVADGDFNGDGDPDLAVATRTSDNAVAILLGGAGGSFGPQTSYRVGGSPRQMAVGDFDRNGHADLAVANSNNVSVLYGGPDGSFEPRISFPTAEYAYAIATDDFNADGNPDLVVANQDVDKLSVLLNNGLSLVPGNIDFPTTVAGDESPTRTVVLTNNRDRDVTVSEVRLTGAASADFVKGDDTCTGATVAPGDTCTTDVRFRPGRVGSPSARLEFTDNAPGSPQSVALSGRATPPVALDPNSYTFAARPDSTTSSYLRVTLSNAGADELVVDAVTLAGPDAGSFRKPPQSDTCADATVAAGDSCTVRVSFRPEGVGPKTARLRFIDDAVTSPQTVPLSGTGTAGPWLTPGAEALKFGGVRVGATSPPKQVTLTNTGSMPMEISSIALEGANPGNFVGLSETCTALASLGPDESCSAEVAFRPNATGSRTARLAIEDTAPGSPHRVELSGSGT